MRANGQREPPRHRLLHDRRGRPGRRRRGGTVGLYHLAWEVPTLDELDEARDRLAAAGALVGCSDHGRQQEPLREGSRRPRVRGDVARARRSLGRGGARSDHPTARPRRRGGASGHGGSGVTARFDPDQPPHRRRGGARRGSPEHRRTAQLAPGRAASVGAPAVRGRSGWPAPRCARPSRASSSLGVIERRGNRAYVAEHLPELQPRAATSARSASARLFEVRRLVEVPDRRAGRGAGHRRAAGRDRRLAAAVPPDHDPRRVPLPRPRVPLGRRPRASTTRCWPRST